MKPINDLQFWKKRIEEAKRGREHYSVYITNEEHWDRINRTHDKILGEVIPKDSKVLDAGCGYGRWSVKFNNYVGVDFSPDFIEEARHKYPDKEFVVGNLKDLPFKDKEFDWSFCVSIKKMVMDNLGEEEWLSMLKELKRVSKKVLICEYENPEPIEIL